MKPDERVETKIVIGKLSETAHFQSAHFGISQKYKALQNGYT